MKNSNLQSKTGTFHDKIEKSHCLEMWIEVDKLSQKSIIEKQ